LPPGRWLVAAAAAGLIVAATTLIVTGGGGRHAAALPSASTLSSSPAPAPTSAPGTVLLTCDSQAQGQLPSNWRAGSLQAGPLWFVYGRQLGYVHHSGSQGAARVPHRPGKLHLVVMIVEVTSGSTAVMKPAAAAQSYFRFLDGFGPDAGYKLPGGATGFTFSSCPRGATGPNGQVTDFYLGFAIEAGRSAPVEIWPSASPRPIRVTFTCPDHGCEG
jgi:hypothetical protein